MKKKYMYFCNCNYCCYYWCNDLFYSNGNNNTIELKKSDGGIEVSYVDGNYKNESKSNLAEIKQDKIWNDDKYCIVEGTVEKANNIEIRIDDKKMYNAIIEIKVESDIKGKIKRRKYDFCFIRMCHHERGNISGRFIY